QFYSTYLYEKRKHITKRMIMSAKALKIVLQGRVQQVGFRYFVYRLASEIGVAGSVMNRNDGSVYIEVEGDSHLVDVFVDHCRKGPPRSQVTDCQLSDAPMQGFVGFTIR
ncbi:hypothetical protein QIJ50_gp1, partial [ssRNA phage SRR6254351_1]